MQAEGEEAGSDKRKGEDRRCLGHWELAKVLVVNQIDWWQMSSKDDVTRAPPVAKNGGGHSPP
jgi:hypothetical protein